MELINSFSQTEKKLLMKRAKKAPYIYILHFVVVLLRWIIYIKIVRQRSIRQKNIAFTSEDKKIII